MRMIKKYLEKKKKYIYIYIKEREKVIDSLDINVIVQ